MTKSITEILFSYGFEREAKRPSVIWWGVGSMVWGSTLHFVQVGKDLYEYDYRTWLYDEWGDEVENVREHGTTHGAGLLQIAFERLPLWYYLRRR